MNKIKDYLDRYFDQYNANRELNELKEELYGNASAHFADLCESGMSEEEAFARVTASFGDLEEAAAATGAQKKEQGLAELFKDRLNEREINEVLIELTSSDLEITSGEVSEPLIDTYERHPALAIGQDDHQFYIRASGWRAPDRVCVTLPIGLPRLTVHCASGEIEANGVRASVCRIESGDGDLTLEKSLFNELEVHTASGDLDIDQITASDSMILSSASGDIHADHIQARILKVKTASGDIDVTARNAMEELSLQSASGDISLAADQMITNFSASTKSGDLDCDLNGSFINAEFNNVSGDIEVAIHGDQDLTIHARTVTGEIYSRLTGDGGSRSLKAHNTSGDIIIR